MELTRQAARMCDVMLEGMLAVLEPGMLETEVASWGYLIGRQIGAESFGFECDGHLRRGQPHAGRQGAQPRH